MRCPHCGSINEQLDGSEKYQVGDELIMLPHGETVVVTKVRGSRGRHTSYTVRVIGYGIEPESVSNIIVPLGQYRNKIEDDLIPVDKYVEIMRGEGLNDPLALKKGITIEMDKLGSIKGIKHSERREEHNVKSRQALQTARKNLAENPNYYSR